MTKEEIEAAVMAVLMGPPNTRFTDEWDYAVGDGGGPRDGRVFVWVPARFLPGLVGGYVLLQDFDAARYADEP